MQFDGVTAVDEPQRSAVRGPSSKEVDTLDKSKPTMNAASLPFVDASDFLNEKRPLCVRIGEGGVRKALQILDKELTDAGLPGLISKKSPKQVIGREVNPGSFGLYEYASQPQLLLEPGRYPGFPLGNWIGCHWHGTFSLSENFPPTVTDHSKKLGVPDSSLSQLGLTIVQVSQNQAAVCLDPQNRVFVIADGGFVALATQGAYKVLGLVDQTHLQTAVLDPYSEQVLGHMQTVKLPGGYVAATFLDIPASNVVVLQRKDELFELGAGQHYLTAASVTIRGFYTKGEVQQEMECNNIYTRDQVPVWLRMYLRYELQNPLELARHGYKTPFDSLQDKTRSILTQILAHLDYSAMARSRNAAPDMLEQSSESGGNDVNAVFVSAVRTQATDELKVVAREYGIKLEDLAIIDRKFEGEIARKMDQLTTRALEAQVESANLDRENQNRRRKQEGDAAVLELQNKMKRANADTDAQNVVAQARARAEALAIETQASAAAIKVTAEAEAQAIRIKAAADATVTNTYAQNIAQSRIEVERTKAFGDKTVFAPLEALNNGAMYGQMMSKK